MRRAKIVRRTLVGGSLALALVLLVVWVDRDGTGRPLLGLTALISLGGALELARMGSLAGRGLAWSLLPALAGALWIEQDRLGMGGWAGTSMLGAPLSWGVALALGAAGWLAARLLRGDAPRVPLLGAALAAAWVTPPLLAMTRVFGAWETGGLVSLLVLSKVGDIAGYYVGSAIGRSHPFPSISPGKTTAGCVGSLAAGTLAGLLLWWGGVLPEGPYGAWGALLLGAWLNVASQAGDLLESWVKRRAGVKDSGAWFGPSGGVLDLTDSLLLSVPALLVAGPWLLHTS
jgi:phosphatidate cytidylyltransferase